MSLNSGFHVLLRAMAGGLLTAASFCSQAIPVVAPASGFSDFAINGTTSASRPELAGVVLYDQLQPFTFTGDAGQSLIGQVQVRVVRSDADSTLDFYWRIFNGESNAPITAFRVSGFDNFALDADWRIDGLGTQAPDTARVFGGADAGSVNFLFGEAPIGSGQQSRFFFLDTQATQFAFAGKYDLLCANSGCISGIYETAVPVPEPQSVALMLGGLGLISLISRRRRRSCDDELSRQ